MDNETVEIEAYGIEKISSNIESVNHKVIAEMLGVSASALNRPNQGEIDILIGQQAASLHPVRSKAVGHLVLMKNEFGLVVSGSHPGIKSTGAIALSCLQARHAVVLHVAGGIEQFFEIEGLGVKCEPKCGSCKCGKCHPGRQDMSLKDAKEYQMIERGLQFDVSKGRWIAAYPWIKSPNCLQANRYVALATLKSTEKRLFRNKERAQLYNQQIKDMLDRSAARKVTEEELSNYNGVKYYIAHFEVMNPKSKSTPCRIVFNSSQRFKGLSLNDCLAKGPSMLNKMLGVLFRFREGRHAFIGDISKMYHSIDIGLTDQMTHLFLWRDLQSDCHPTTYAMTVVNMGDRPSATIAQVALRKSAEEDASIFPEACRVITENTYMDDIAGSTDSESCSMKLIHDIEYVLAPRNFKIKEWILSGSTKHKAIEMKTSLGDVMSVDKERVLGIQWDPGADMLEFEMNRPMETISTTKRTMLSIIMKIFDPLGLLTPFTVRLKMLLRKIWACDPKIGWDDELPNAIEAEWNQLTSTMNRVDKIRFVRSVTPDDAKGKPILVVFSDGSIEAYGAVAYARWECEDGGFKSCVIAAKSRMAPLKTVDIVRIELCGAVLSSRLRATIEKEMNLQFAKVVHMVDSEIVQAMIHKESYGFNTFVSNRIGEIHQTTEQNDWYWIPGKPSINVADITTRGCPLTEVDQELWQNGPEFLQLPEDSWPVKRQPRNDIVLPEIKQRFVGVAQVEAGESILNRFNLSRFSKWKLLLHTTARMLNLYGRFKLGSRKTNELLPEDLRKAENEWIKQAQKQLNLKALKRFQPVVEDGIVVVGGRTERWMQATWNRQRFVLLPKDHPISKLIAKFQHDDGGHLGVTASIAKVRYRYWIIGIHKIMRSIISKCIPCRKKLKQMCEQIMSPLPEERLQPSPPFTNVCIDYFGPYQIKGEVQKRVRGKAYGVMFTCLAVRAVYLDVASDYSTDSFLQVLRRFACARGWPQKIVSDPGTQLVGASRELREQISGLDWKRVREFGHKHGVEWNFSPGDAPWYNGTAEALIKSTKRALGAAVGEAVLSFSELQTCLMEAAQLVNQRPIGVLPNSPNDGTYLCPNDLLLGRATAQIPQGPFKERTTYKHRLDFIQSIVSAFWKRWSREAFPNLVLQPKWHTERRNLMAGDIVWLQDSNKVRGKWKMALVKEPLISQDGLVRRVKLKYRTDAETDEEVERPVQRLILLAAADDSSAGAECSVTPQLSHPQN